MRLSTILVPLSGLVSLVDANPFAVEATAAISATGADSVIQSDLEHNDSDLESIVIAIPIGFGDDSNNALSAMLESATVDKRQTTGSQVSGKCDTGVAVDFQSYQTLIQLLAAKQQGESYCLNSGRDMTWSIGADRFKLANRTGALRCRTWRELGFMYAWLSRYHYNSCDHKRSVWAWSVLHPKLTLSVKKA